MPPFPHISLSHSSLIYFFLPSWRLTFGTVCLSCSRQKRLHRQRAPSNYTCSPVIHQRSNSPRGYTSPTSLSVSETLTSGKCLGWDDYRTKNWHTHTQTHTHTLNNPVRLIQFTLPVLFNNTVANAFKTKSLTGGQRELREVDVTFTSSKASAMVAGTSGFKSRTCNLLFASKICFVAHLSIKSSGCVH